MRIVCFVLGVCVLGCTAFERDANLLAPQPEPASLSGRVVTRQGALSAAELSRAVVYLEPIGAAQVSSMAAAFELHHGDARLTPNLLAVAPGDEVVFVNDDSIFHGAFSYSRPNAFDLGTYGPGERRVVRFEHAGPVLFHCPIHSDEAGVVFVVPTRLVARPSERGSYRIAGAAAGRYWLRVWADGFPAVAHDVTLRPGEAAFRDIVVGTARPNPARGASAGASSAAPPPPARAR